MVGFIFPNKLTRWVDCLHFFPHTSRYIYLWILKNLLQSEVLFSLFCLSRAVDTPETNPSCSWMKCKLQALCSDHNTWMIAWWVSFPVSQDRFEVVALWDIWNSLIRDVADFMVTCQARLGFITKLDLEAGG